MIRWHVLAERVGFRRIRLFQLLLIVVCSGSLIFFEATKLEKIFTLGFIIPLVYFFQNMKKKEGRPRNIKKLVLVAVVAVLDHLALQRSSTSGREVRAAPLLPSGQLPAAYTLLHD